MRTRTDPILVPIHHDCLIDPEAEGSGDLLLEQPAPDQRLSDDPLVERRLHLDQLARAPAEAPAQHIAAKLLARPLLHGSAKH